ncbi:MAG: hypothetical protein FJ184_10660 [Gammaproteobacteria bacterium]|nr:hypothetical protein [Gammaproteobacteria bacterium]
MRPSVGLVVVASEAYALANNALVHSAEAYPFSSVTVVTDRPELWPNFRTVEIPTDPSVDAVAHALLSIVPKYVDAEFIISASFDGFIIDPKMFSEDYFGFDYIGPTKSGYASQSFGRGGFSWRSRRLMLAASQLASDRPNAESDSIYISQTIRKRLELEHNCVFAPDDVNRSFLREGVSSASPTFGFSGLICLPSLYREAPKFLIDNLPKYAFRDYMSLIREGLNALTVTQRGVYEALIDSRLRSTVGSDEDAKDAGPSSLFDHLYQMAHGRSENWTPYSSKPLKTGDERVIAYYLPQYHVIPENDMYWGGGFTEWRNVSRALPLFRGHYQPRHPADLGFYDLRNPEIMHRQAVMARNYGLGGWALYYYWFDARRILDMPIEYLYRNRDIDMSYCVFWANENWTRSWDGMENEVLLAQRHSPSDDIAFISHVSRYFEDSRYIRRGGKPVLMMYRPQLLPDAVATTDRWREWCLKRGFGDLYLIATDAYSLGRPSRFGFDAAAEFPPHRGVACDPEAMRAASTSHCFGPRRGIQCIDYSSAVDAWTRQAPQGSDKLFKCVFPMWDNSPRRITSIPTVFHGGNPSLYKSWLSYCLTQAASDDFVFINAWNEWAEGAYLEPDLRHGYAYLDATWEAIQSARRIRDTLAK